MFFIGNKVFEDLQYPAKVIKSYLTGGTNKTVSPGLCISDILSVAVKLRSLSHTYSRIDPAIIWLIIRPVIPFLYLILDAAWWWQTSDFTYSDVYELMQSFACVFILTWYLIHLHDMDNPKCRNSVTHADSAYILSIMQNSTGSNNGPSRQLSMRWRFYPRSIRDIYNNAYTYIIYTEYEWNFSDDIWIKVH